MSLSDIKADSLGTNVRRLRWTVIVAATLVTAATVSLAGIVGWVALVIPHIARMIVGSNHQALLLASIAIGAGYLLLIDTVARNAAATEIPLSILTAVIGTPFFAWLLMRAKADSTAVDLSAVAGGTGGGFVINGVAADDLSGCSVRLSVIAPEPPLDPVAQADQADTEEHQPWPMAFCPIEGAPFPRALANRATAPVDHVALPEFSHGSSIETALSCRQIRG